MNSTNRRNQIAEFLNEQSGPVSGSALAEKFSVSRQIVVSDISALRSQGYNIISTNKGYLMSESLTCSRVFKLNHTDEQVKEELEIVVNHGGCVKNVFVNHKMYGRLSAPMDISTHRQIADYLNDIQYGKSAPLKNVTSGYHYHTVLAESEDVLDRIEEEFTQKGFIVK